MFDVGQQKDKLRATGNSPTEPLDCRELPGSLGKQEREAGQQRGARPSNERLWQLEGQSTGFSDHRSSPQGYQPPFSLPHRH